MTPKTDNTFEILSDLATKLTPPQPPAADPKTCVHDWQFNTKTHEHECSKCHTPAPENWNEVGF